MNTNVPNFSDDGDIPDGVIKIQETPATKSETLPTRHAKVRWTDKVTEWEKAMAYDMLVACDFVKPGKASHALWIAHQTKKRCLSRSGKSTTASTLTQNK